MRAPAVRGGEDLTQSRRRAQRDEPPAPLDPESAPVDRWSLLRKLLPELTVAIGFAVWAVVPGYLGEPTQEDLFLVAAVEGGLLLFQGTLTDLASRLKRRLPFWLLVPIAPGLLLLSPGAASIAAGLWQAGIGIFLPFAWSIGERLAELWTLPGASRLETLRRRALVSGRLTLGFGIAVAACGTFFAGLLAGQASDVFGWLDRGLPAAGAIYFAVTAADAWRVHRPGFARRPTSLVPRFDPLGVTYLAEL